ncbi:MAG: DUF4468 domain-containing protein [Bacteroidaceae bacterium]|nr:DUF4468 domain-containing protein [Bacteroidaceae bacterium]
MKKILPLIVMLLFATAAEAQLFKKREKAPVKTEYLQGAVPVENNRVVFRHTIAAPGLSAQEIKQRVEEWYNTRYVKPTIISAKVLKSDNSGTFEAKAEEYIVFKKKLLVLNRARIYYYLTVNCTDNGCEAIISRITYWHDDEAPDGGIRYNAEEIITDKEALNGGKLRKHPGRFRTKTIDLKNGLFEEIEKAINR